MPIDFKKLGAQSPADTSLDPRQIFTALPKNKKYSFPRDVQTQVWEQWLQRKDKKDLIIKMNTGSGKTIVGLMILKSSLNEKKGPAVYITPDNYLKDQVIKEAKELGLPVTEDEHDAGFSSGRSILVINVSKLFNGKSVFGIGDTGIRIPIGTLIFDDSHSCISKIREQFTVSIGSTHPAYIRILDLFKDAIDTQSPTKYMEIQQGDPSVFVRIPFWSWRKQIDVIIKILLTYQTDKEVMFSFPLIKEIIKGCSGFFGGGKFEVSPAFLPIETIPSYLSSSRRIFMSATISDETELVTDLGCDSKSITKIINPKSAGDLGDRMILVPSLSNPQIADDELRNALSTYGQKMNVVVLVPSTKRAELWATFGAEIVHAQNSTMAVEKLKNSKKNFMVFVNKYDGIDLPDDACRILVIDCLPEAQSLSQKYENLLLSGSEIHQFKQINRIEQGMGRGTRSNEDYCVVFLMGKNLVNMLNRADSSKFFGAGTLAQLKLAESMTEQLKGQSLREIFQAVDACLSRNRDWVNASKGVLSDLTLNENAKLDALEINLKNANKLLLNGQYAKAAEQIQEIVNKCADPRVKGYVQQILAECIGYYDESNSQELLLSAKMNNPSILKPLAGVAYSRINQLGVQELAAKEFYKKYLEPNDMIISMQGVLEDLIFDEDLTSRFESSIEYLGKFLGFNTQRPDFVTNIGPDGLWAVGDQTFWVIECKSGVDADKLISKDHVNQLSGSVNWFNNKYDTINCFKIPVLVHPNHKLDQHASKVENMFVMDKGCIAKLKTSVNSYLTAISHKGAYKDADEIRKSLLANGLYGHESILKNFAIRI